MSDVSRAAALAWKIAAAEAGASRHPRIDTSHLLIGILSLGKADSVQEFSPAERLEFQSERTGVEAVLGHLGLHATTLRRSLRERLGAGTHKHQPKAAISRTDACKAVFARAHALASPANVTCLHLLAALTESADSQVERLLREANVKPEAVRRLAYALALVEGIARKLRAEHGVRLSVDSAAERFLSAPERAKDEKEIQKTVERFVGAPVAELVRSGKLRRASSWRVVHEDGGVYVIPGE